MRLGITASRKVGCAVVRNRCRRRVRALVSVAGQELERLPVDVVVNAKRELAEAPWQELVGDFQRCLRKGLRRLRPPE